MGLPGTPLTEKLSSDVHIKVDFLDLVRAGKQSDRQLILTKHVFNTVHKVQRSTTKNLPLPVRRHLKQDSWRSKWWTDRVTSDRNTKSAKNYDVKCVRTPDTPSSQTKPSIKTGQKITTVHPSEDQIPHKKNVVWEHIMRWKFSTLRDLSHRVDWCPRILQNCGASFRSFWIEKPRLPQFLQPLMVRSYAIKRPTCSQWRFFNSLLVLPTFSRLNSHSLLSNFFAVASCRVQANSTHSTKGGHSSLKTCWQFKREMHWRIYPIQQDLTISTQHNAILLAPKHPYPKSQMSIIFGVLA